MTHVQRVTQNTCELFVSN